MLISSKYSRRDQCVIQPWTGNRCHCTRVSSRYPGKKKSFHTGSISFPVGSHFDHWLCGHWNAHCRSTDTWVWPGHVDLPCTSLSDRSCTSSSSWFVVGTHYREFRNGLFHVRKPVYLFKSVRLIAKSRCSWISIGTYYASNLTVQWRVPLAMACVGPLALLIGLPFIPGAYSSSSIAFDPSN